LLPRLLQVGGLPGVVGIVGIASPTHLMQGKPLPEAPPQLLNTSALLEFKTSSWDSQSGATPPNKGREGVIAEDL
jgi:hypothetical protein